MNTEVGIYKRIILKRKKENTLSTKKTTKKKRKVFFFFSWSLSWSRASFIFFFLIAFLVEIVFSYILGKNYTITNEHPVAVTDCQTMGCCPEYPL